MPLCVGLLWPTEHAKQRDETRHDGKNDDDYAVITPPDNSVWWMDKDDDHDCDSDNDKRRKACI